MIKVSGLIVSLLDIRLRRLCKTHSGILRLWRYSMIVVYLHWERWASGRISVEFCNCHWSLVFLALECPSLTGFFLQAACILSQALNFHTYRSHRALLGTRKCQYFRKQLRIDMGQFWWIQLFQKDKKRLILFPQISLGTRCGCPVL